MGKNREEKYSRPSIPEDIKREVRKRCGFGCVICGSPIYDYEHMEEWSIVQRHKADEITLLCPMHHREKTAKRMPPFIVKEANKNPHNFKSGVSDPYEVLYYQDDITVKLGFMKFQFINKENGAYLVPLVVDRVPIILIEIIDEHYSINMNLFDENNNLVLKIENNSLVYGIGLWDVTFQANRLTVREMKNKIFIEIVFEVPNVLSIPRGVIYCNGEKLTLTPSSVVFDNHNFRMEGDGGLVCQFGIVMGEGKDEFPGGIKI